MYFLILGILVGIIALLDPTCLLTMLCNPFLGGARKQERINIHGK